MVSIVDRYIEVKTVNENGDIVTALIPKREPPQESPPKTQDKEKE